MGNSQSDNGEKQAYDVIKFIPFVNVAYSATRAVVYAGKGDDTEAKLSGVGLAVGCVETAAWVVPIPGAGPAASAGVRAAAAIAGPAIGGAIAVGAHKGLEAAEDAVRNG